ncbi:hypothetical protein, partial [Arenibacter aquaticus]|uniref:hypothetical protein n=1 Tax=Arenibacter aquaticus TaxID=2489054 RepID=UPI001EE423A7
MLKFINWAMALCCTGLLHKATRLWSLTLDNPSRQGRAYFGYGIKKKSPHLMMRGLQKKGGGLLSH